MDRNDCDRCYWIAALICASTFSDRSDAAGLGPLGAGGNRKGYSLSVCDVNGDGWPDVLYGAGTGLLLLNTARGFLPIEHAQERLAASG
jgi:hypothetical protein